MKKLPKKVRVIASTYNTNNEKIAMIGGEYEVRADWYYDNTIDLWNKDKTDSRGFNTSDVQELTPLSFNGKTIAIGDEVRTSEKGGAWATVFDYCYWDGEYGLMVAVDNDYENSCYIKKNYSILDHRTPTSDIIEVDGKKYPKDKLIERLKGLDEVK